MKQTQPARVRLGIFELDLRSGELRAGDQKTVLQEQPLQILRMLVEHEGELVGREEIRKKLWPNDTIVEFDHSINAAIKNLRRVLGDSADDPKYIETLARRGYRLMVAVERISTTDSNESLAAEPPPAKPDSDSGGTPAVELNTLQILKALTPQRLEKIVAAAGASTPSPAGSAAAAPAISPAADSSADSQSLSIEADPNAPIFSVGEVVSERYLVVRFMARGGMGQVYEVNDVDLKSRVALKTIAPARASSPRQVNRFRQEIQLARTVSHPNVCRVFDLGRHRDDRRGEVLYLTMELVPGETLSARLRDHGPMSCEEALPLIRQMVSALAAAHDVGIVHRDFKPGNVILLPPGSGVALKITDFGLATIPELQETISGTHPDIVGTPDYMPPEQFHGECSKRTDVYALGVTVFQMVTGTLPAKYQTPFKSPSGGGKAADSRDREQVGGSRKPSEDSRTRRIPQRWRDAISTAMAVNPGDRFAGVEEFWSALSGERMRLRDQVARSLRRHPISYSLTTCALVALIALVLTGVISNPFWAKPQERHLAVLPFLNIGNDPTDKAFAEGVSETLTSKLSQLERFQKSFWVVPAGDARTAKSPEEAHRNLDVTLAVTGSVERTQDGVEVTTNLIDAAKHRQLASRTLNVPSISLEDLQQQVWESVADMLDLQVPAEVNAELAAGGTSHPEAYQLYEQGNGYLQHMSGTDHAIELFNKALAIDPNYALAYAGLGEAYGNKYFQTKDPQWAAKATQSAGRAVELNGRLIPARMSLARVYVRTGQLDKALAEFKRVLEQDPTVTAAEDGEARVYRDQRHFREAEDLYKRVIARHPTYWLGYDDLGELYYSTGHFQEAAQQFQAATDLAPDTPGPYYSLGGAYIAAGRYDDAIGVLKKGLAIKPSAEEWTNLGAAYMFLGKWEEAADAMKWATELSPHDDVMWRNLGDAYDQIPSHSADARQAYQKALDLATQQLKVNPKEPNVLSYAALYNAHLGNPEAAQDYIQRAFQVAPKDSDVLFTEALVYELTGHRDMALKAIDDAAKAGYSIEEIDKEPELGALHNDPRYKNWLHQHGPVSGSVKN